LESLFEYLSVDLLQPLEISQNRQSFLWKSLEETSGNSEKLGKKLGGGGSYPRPIVGPTRTPTAA
jgi:hypothetical protein